MQDQRNLLLAIVISIAILLGFQFFIAQPDLEDQPRELAQTESSGTGDSDPAADGGATPEGVAPLAGNQSAEELRQSLLEPATRSEALAQSDRVEINTGRVSGSINLTGARLDDLTLLDYRESPDPESREIVLLSPRNAPAPYYADFGWLAQAGMDVPDTQTVWSADGEELTADNPITLTWANDSGLTFEKTISIDEDFMVSVTQRVTNESGDPVTISPYGRVVRMGTPETLGFFILHEGPYGVFNETLQEYNYDDLREEGRTEHETTGGWLGFTDKYWLVALAPDQSMSFDGAFIHQAAENRDQYFATFQHESRVIAAGESFEETTNLFAGAKEVRLMDQYRDQYGITMFDRTIDFGWFYFLTKPIFYALAWINEVVGNFGVAILVLTVFIKLLFFPLANKSYKAMSRMKALQPDMMSIRERFQDDRQKMNMELMELYKREKVNPAAGCLPILVQIPVFFALYKVLFVTIEMRHAPFFGWIRDLSAPDPTSIFNLFGLLPYDVPGILTIGVWPLIMGLTMFAQQKLNPAPADPMQQKIFMFLPVVFTILLAGFPAGLVIYWAWNNSLSVLQQYVIMRRMGVPIGGGAATPAHAPPSAERKKLKGESTEGKPEHSGEEADEPESAADADSDSSRAATGGDGAAGQPASAPATGAPVKRSGGKKRSSRSGRKRPARRAT
ncbi:membrane protein insertase YidC [Fodinicurvata sp. EGI_FJ10296]|uniref:membrane protein insertase YidC n=1 Tax=Fodinicurvata sp. EGI_FJ10296 TaxID=3231908 RepID=UPI0034536AC8